MEGRIFWTYFHGISHKMEFNADYTEAVLLEPKRNPASRIKLPVNNYKEGPLDANEKRIAGLKFDWLHNGSTKNCELVLRENRTCNGCGSEGKWSMEGTIFWTYFHGISHKM